jgi:hypothetical protein
MPLEAKEFNRGDRVRILVNDNEEDIRIGMEGRIVSYVPSTYEYAVILDETSSDFNSKEKFFPVYFTADEIEHTD